MAKSHSPYIPPPTKTLPDLKNDFYKARRPEFPSAETAQGPVSMVQIDALKSSLPTVTKPPALVNEMDPPGMATVKVPKATPTPTQRIQFMESRLKETKGVAKDRFQRVAPNREP